LLIVVRAPLFCRFWNKSLWYKNTTQEVANTPPPAAAAVVIVVAVVVVEEELAVAKTLLVIAGDRCRANCRGIIIVSILLVAGHTHNTIVIIVLAF
jgi:hypothetical protein